MDKENQKKVSIEVNEVSSERMDQPEVKVFTDMIKNMLQHCGENRIPIICLSADPKTSVAVLGAQGSYKDFLMLLVDLIKRVPDFERILKDALEYTSLQKMAEGSVESLIKEVFGRKGN